MDTVTAMALRWSLGGLFGRKKQPPPKPRPPDKQFHAVSIIPGETACAAAYRFTKQRFLSAYAPRLPLPTCDAARCTCRYKHHKDRRAGPRRRGDWGGPMVAQYNGTERRRTNGRRADDKH